jgi:hypothetical protein
MSKRYFSILATLMMIIGCVCFIPQAMAEVRVNVMTPGTQPTVAPSNSDNKTQVNLPKPPTAPQISPNDDKQQMQSLSRLLPLSAKIVPEKTSMKQLAVLTVQGGTAPYTVSSSSSFLTITPSGPNTYQVTQNRNATGVATLKVRDTKGQETSISVHMALTINFK